MSSVNAKHKTADLIGQSSTSQQTLVNQPIDATDSLQVSASFETVRSGYLFKVDELERALRESSYPEELQGLKGLESRRVYRTLKRVFDILFSVVIFVLFWWLYLLLAIIIKIDDPKGSPIFAQQRVGKNGKPFTTNLELCA